MSGSGPAARRDGARGLRADSLGPPRIRRRLAELGDRALNFDRATVERDPPPAGWRVEEIGHPLRAEAPGPPAPDGTFALAQRLITGYEFADPSIVRAYYDPEQPLAGRNMILRVRALGVVTVLVGVRILEVIDESGRRGGRPVTMWGWRYGTLEGHLEMGEMSWEVWKWRDTGEVEFRVHAVSREAPIANPIIRYGFRIVGPHERRAFLDSTCRRMSRFTEIGLDRGAPEQPLREAAAELTARPGRAGAAHERLARRVTGGR